MPFSDPVKRLRDARKANGLCTRCGKAPLAMNKYGTKLSTRCEQCNAKQRVNEAHSYDNKRRKPQPIQAVPKSQESEQRSPPKFELPPPGLTLKEIEDFYLKPPPKKDGPVAQFINAIEKTGFDDDMQNRYGEIRKGLY